MKKLNNQITLILLLFAISWSNLYGQILLRETSLEKQINNSSFVIEGKVLSKKSFWDVENKNIYTVNVIEVYKVFKGDLLATIEIITEGGTVGLSAQIVTPSLKLNVDDVGVFMLYENNVNLKSKTANKKFKTYGSLQGFYKYNLDTDEAINPFNKKRGISSTLYSEIINITKTDYVEIKNVSLTSKHINSNKGLLVPGGITFTPTNITAGTKSILTINGTGFGSSAGKVSFSDADDGGATFIDALGSQIISWNNSQIRVEVPSGAGTGIIKVTDNVTASATSSGILTVTYAELNVIYDADDMTASGGSNGPLPAYAYRTQHVQTSTTRTFYLHSSFNANTNAKAAFIRALDTWRCETGINWVINGTATTKNVAARDDENVVRFDIGAELDADVLGKCYTWTNGCTSNGTGNWFVVEIDLVFDDATDWNFGPAPTPAVIGKYDFESNALHELGHGHLLGHVIDNNDVMHFALQTALDRRVLGASNITCASAIQTRSTSSLVCSQPLMTNHPCSLSIEEEELKEAISIYPNPAKGTFNIKNSSLLSLDKVVIYDIRGRLISEYDMRNSARIKTINLYGASKGMYFVNIHSEKTMITKKLILE